MEGGFGGSHDLSTAVDGETGDTGREDFFD